MTPRARSIPLALAAAAAAVLATRALADAAADGGHVTGAGEAPKTALVASPLAPFTVVPEPMPERLDRPVLSRWSRHRVAVPVAETLAANLVVMGWNRFVGDASWADVSLDSVGRNLRSGWVLDDDQFWVNQFGHPYQGTWSFTAARSAGLGFWASTPFTFGASALWELAGETERPALNDQVTTTVAGVVLGEVLWRFSGALRAEGGAWNEALAGVLAPMGALNRRLLGTAGQLRAPPSRWQLALGGAAFDGAAGEPLAAPAGYASLSFTYGVPGSPDLELDRPFDHFVLDVGWTTSADPAATVIARGLVAGDTFAVDGARGLYGAFLSFDLDTPPRHRVSTSAVGFGGSAAADLGAGFALEGDAIASAVILGAAGTTDRGADGLGRDYRFGPGQQGLLAVRVLAGSRASAGVSVRQYLLFGADGDRGSELLVDGSATAVVRIAGAHGIGLEASRYYRRAGPEGAVVRQADSAVRLYYTFLGGTAGAATWQDDGGTVASRAVRPDRG